MRISRILQTSGEECGRSRTLTESRFTELTADQLLQEFRFKADRGVEKRARFGPEVAKAAVEAVGVEGTGNQSLLRLREPRATVLFHRTVTQET
jgi:hypothetical protein